MKYGGGPGGAAAILGSDAYHNAKNRFRNPDGGLADQFKRGRKEADAKAAFGGKDPYVLRDSVPPRGRDTSSQMTGGDASGSPVQTDRQFSKMPTSDRLNKARASKERRFK